MSDGMFRRHRFDRSHYEKIRSHVGTMVDYLDRFMARLRELEACDEDPVLTHAQSAKKELSELLTSMPNVVREPMPD